MSNHQKPMDRSYYLTATLEEHCLNGDAYVSEETLYNLCKNKMKNLPFSVFSNDLREIYIQPERYSKHKKLSNNGNSFIDIAKCLFGR